MARPKQIDPETRIRLSRKVAAAKSREELYVSTALFSAYSAAIQVLETEIRFLKKPPKDSEEFEIGAFFVDVLVDMIIGQAAGKVLNRGLEAMLRPVIRSRQAYYVMPHFYLPEKAIEVKHPPEVKLTAEQIKRIRKDAQKQLRTNFAQVVNSDEYVAYKRVPEAIVASVLSVSSGKVQTALKQPPASRSDPAGREGDTPVVQVLNSAQDAYNEQKTAVDNLYADLDATVKLANIDTETARELEAFLDENVGEGMDANSVATYRDLFLRYYEFSMWAHSIELTAVVKRKPKNRGHAMGDQRLGQFLRDPREFAVYEQDANHVHYRYPAAADVDGRMGGVVMEGTVAIAKDRLDYWVSRFPFDWDDLGGPTVLQKYEQSSAGYKKAPREEGVVTRGIIGEVMADTSGRMDSKAWSEATRVMAYNRVLKMFESADRDLKERYRKLKDGRALNP